MNLSHPALPPLLDPVRALVVDGVPPSVEALDQALAAAGVHANGRPLRAVLQPPKRRRAARRSIGETYDGRIRLRSEVPTRDRNVHDLFNVSGWLAFPRAKEAVNRRQYEALVARVPESFHRLPGARSREQDALAMLDEGGLLLVVHDARIAVAVDAAVAEGDEAALRAGVAAGAVQAVLFGHAIAEELVALAEGAEGAARAFPVRLTVAPTDRGSLAAIDRALALRLADPTFLADPSGARGVKVERALFAAPS